MTLKVTDADMERAGFQITAVDASNNYVGTFIENPSAVREASAFPGLTHGTPRTPISGVVSWTIQWTAPSTGNAPVKFYYAGNAATGGGTGGDFIYTGSSALIPLPVSLSHFEAKVVQAIPVLTWATASEVHTKDFEMERSNDGKVFEKIGERKAKGSNSNYTFSDENPLTVAYYRLKINDLDGKFEYSKVVSVESDVRSTVRVKPTFVKDVLTVEGAIYYEIVDGTGRFLLQSIENQLNVQSLPQGFYVVRGRDVGGNPFIQKIIKN
jgi:hypothetical protein